MNLSPPDHKSRPGRLLPRFLRGMRRLGFTVIPFLTVREGETPSSLGVATAELPSRFADTADIDALLKLQPSQRREEVANWLADGKKCFIVEDGAKIVAKMWCDLDAFSYPPSYRPLENDEAYLFAAYADPAYRGRNLAPLMRASCYEALRRIGRTRFYSYTDYFNLPARRFKAKLFARDEALRVHVDLWGRWSRTFTLRRY